MAQLRADNARLNEAITGHGVAQLSVLGTAECTWQQHETVLGFWGLATWVPFAGHVGIAGQCGYLRLQSRS